MIGMEARFAGIAELAGTPSVAVVVDVMRAFTVAAWAFARGAEKVVLAGTLDEALALKARHPDWVTLKDGPPAPGFDAVNSPAMLRSAFSSTGSPLPWSRLGRTLSGSCDCTRCLRRPVGDQPERWRASQRPRITICA